MSKDNSTLINVEIPNVWECIIEYRKTHSKSETYLYNNRLYFVNTGKGISYSGFMTQEEYNTNWEWINKS